MRSRGTEIDWEINKCRIHMGSSLRLISTLKEKQTVEQAINMMMSCLDMRVKIERAQTHNKSKVLRNQRCIVHAGRKCLKMTGMVNVLPTEIKTINL